MTIVIDSNQMTETEARKITTSIQLLLDSAQSTLDRLEEKVIEAYDRRADLALGYESWDEYANAEFADKARYLPRSDRREFTIKLAVRGMSSRAIAPIVGVSDRQVRNDVGSHFPPAEPTFDPTPTLKPRADDWSEPVTVNMATGEVIDAPVTTAEMHTVKTVIGLDGKNYTHQPKEPRRPSLVDDAYRANTELWKAIERFRAIRNDDRFTRNKADILAALQPSADLATEILADLFTPEGDK